ncbi:MAG: hypothetical protein ABID63_09870 [Pseudomonadota bacterium]
MPRSSCTSQNQIAFNAPLNLTFRPFLRRIGTVLLNRMVHFRLQRSHRRLMDQLDDRQLDDVGLERHFDGRDRVLRMKERR